MSTFLKIGDWNNKKKKTLYSNVEAQASIQELSDLLTDCNFTVQWLFQLQKKN